MLAVTVFRLRRDLSTLLWATGLVIVLGAWPELVSGMPLILAWAAPASLYLGLTRRSRGLRLTGSSA